MLKNGVFRRLWFTQTLSSVGDEIRNWAILFWVFAEADQAVFYRTALLFAEMLPVFIMAPLAGTWVDRRNPKKVLQATLVIRALMSIVLAGLIWFEQIPLLLIMLAFTCTVQQFFQPAISKLTVAAVDNEDYGTASSSVRTADTLISLAGPAIGAFVYQWWGASTSLIVDGFCFFFGSLLILKINLKPAPPAALSDSDPVPSFWKDLLEGFRYILSSPLTKRLFVLLAIMGMSTGAINLLNIYFVVNELHLDQNFLAWASTAGGIGMFAGAFGLNVLGARFKNYIQINIWGAAIMTLGLLLLTLSFSSISMLLSRIIIGIGISLLSITLSTLLMTYVPENLLGRVGSVFEGGPLATNMLSYVFFGWLYVYTGARFIFGISFILFFIAFLLAISLQSLTSPARKAQADPKETAAALFPPD
ncbi:MFS transporter [Paenibacillus sp. HW567]|uniref:MFS transporter n=1 Tax=Paenibacillus sp. HW567 TaxID=1034769 RepID=UPI0012EB2A42|nr:MFS transporter [Paenibacillus sp. HW567]